MKISNDEAEYNNALAELYKKALAYKEESPNKSNENIDEMVSQIIKLGNESGVYVK